MMKSYVICVNNDGYEVSLELRKLYEVLPDDQAANHNQLRVIDESGEDYLFPAALFLPIELSDAIQRHIESAA